MIDFAFDRPMRRDSYSSVPAGDGAYPDCPARPFQSAGRRRFSRDRTLVSGRHDAIGIDVGPYRNFAGADDNIPAGPAKLVSPVPRRRRRRRRHCRWPLPTLDAQR